MCRVDPENHYPEVDKIRQFVDGLRQEFQIPVQAENPITISQAVNKAKFIEVAYSKGSSLSAYSLLPTTYQPQFFGGYTGLNQPIMPTQSQHSLRDDLMEAVQYVTRTMQNHNQNRNSQPQQNNSSQNNNNNNYRNNNNNYRNNNNNNYRPPQQRNNNCLRCNRPGHFAANCSAPFCTNCQQIGHGTRNCRLNQNWRNNNNNHYNNNYNRNNNRNNNNNRRNNNNYNNNSYNNPTPNNNNNQNYNYNNNNQNQNNDNNNYNNNNNNNDNNQQRQHLN